jgi:hypothetical protein
MFARSRTSPLAAVVLEDDQVEVEEEAWHG